MHTIAPPAPAPSPTAAAPPEPTAKKVTPPSNVNVNGDTRSTEVKAPPEHESDAMRELEDLDIPAERKPYKPKKADKEVDKQIEPEEDKPVEPVKSEETEAEPEKQAETKPVKAAELRVAYEKSKETLKAKDAEIAKLQTELKTAKSAPVDDPEKKVLLEKFEAAEKRRSELEKEIAFVAYHKSKEFVDKYQKPYEEAWTKAVAELAELSIENEDGTSRTATSHDLLTLANLPLGEARKRANQMFGDAADDVMAHRRKIRELSDAQTKALDDAKKNSETVTKENQTQALQQQERIKTLWADENKAWQEKFPRWFKPEDGDEEGNALLAKGYEMADAAFSNQGTPEERVKLHAQLRNKAAAFPKLALHLKKARTRIKELETALAAYEDSEPAAGEGGKQRSITPTGSGMDEAFSELDSIGKRK